MFTSVRSRYLITQFLSLCLLCGFGLAPGVAGAIVASHSVDELRELVARDGWLRVRVELASVPAAQTSGGASVSTADAEAKGAAVEDLLFMLPEGSYADVQRGPENSSLTMRVDPAGLDELLASSEVAEVNLAITAESLEASNKLGDYASDRILVKFRTEMAEAQVNGLFTNSYDVPAWLEPERKHFSTWVVSVTDPIATIPEVVDAVRRLPNVEYAEPDYRVRIAARPNDASFGSLWGLENRGQTGGTSAADIGAVAAWDLTTGDPGTVVAVIDTGVDYTHPDLAGNMWVNTAERNGRPGVDDDGNGYIDDIHGINAITGSGNPMDDHSHGTHCAGTIGAIGNNGLGVTGVSWRTKIMALKFIDSYGYGYTSDQIQALQYATMMKTRYGVNVRVTSNSYGGGDYSKSEKDAIQASVNAGILFVAAAGNDTDNNDTTPSYPASYDNAGLIAVASSDHNDRLSWFSNYGATSVDLAAPGSAILSTLPKNRYGTYSGTSMATPHVAGAAALLWAYDPRLSVTAAKSRLLQTVDANPAFAGRMVSGGRLNVYAALMGGSSAPAAPSKLTATAVSSTQINLAWADNSSNEQGFRIQRNTGGSTWAHVATVSPNVTSYLHSNLTPDTTYPYRVVAFGAGGALSGYSNTASATTQVSSARPRAPTGLTATVNSRSKITLRWSDRSTNERGFRIERRTGTGAWTQIGQVGANVITFANTGLSAGTRYSYRVLARNTAGVSVYSNDVTATTQGGTAAKPKAPSNLVARAASNRRVNLTWRDNANHETGYWIERKIGTAAWVQIAEVPANTTSFVNLRLSPNTSYRYRVRAFNAGGISAFATSAEVKTPR